MTHLLQDILDEPGELSRLVRRMAGRGAPRLDEAARVLRGAPFPILTGMGSSFHAALAAQSFFDAAGRPARAVDASECLRGMRLPDGAVLVVLSRSGRSVEIVELLPKAQAAGAMVIGITNDPESPLARGAQLPLLLDAQFDFNVSVTMYTGVALTAAWIAALATDAWRDELAEELTRALAASEQALPRWREQLATGDWLTRAAPTFFLARGAALAAALEARQLWEEAAKHPATALGTGGFRHGPQEAIEPGTRVVLWLAPSGVVRWHDLALAADLKRIGAKVALVGQGLARDAVGAADLLLELPAIGEAWQFLLDVIPLQLAAEQLAQVRGVDCDRFRYCPYVVESESGLGEGGGA